MKDVTKVLIVGNNTLIVNQCRMASMFGEGISAVVCAQTKDVKGMQEHLEKYAEIAKEMEQTVKDYNAVFELVAKEI